MELTVNEQNKGQRIDAFISQEVQDISRSLAQTLIKEKKILLNGNTTKVSTKLEVGDIVFVPENIEKETQSELIAENIPIDVIYEDDDILVINKPKNMVVHPAVRKQKWNTCKCNTW